MAPDPALLPPGVTVHGRNGQACAQVQAFLGQGGQGAVYRVAHASGQVMALKWYHPHYVQLDTGLSERLALAVARGAPEARFLWPLDVVHQPGQASFGYLMPLRQPAYVGMQSLLAPPAERVLLPLKKRISVCLQMARSFLALHAQGFCYQDLNFGNFFLHPQTAQVLICDTDNVNVDGAAGSVLGTRKFMAPEVVRRQALPNTRTDLYSMAVMFHYVLMGWHPLDGQREHALPMLTAQAEHALYGTQPLFMFDPLDARNGPVVGYHEAVVQRWQALPSRLRQLFERAFGPGLSAPYERVLESEWIAQLEAIEHAIVPCSSCGHEHGVQAPTPPAAPHEAQAAAKGAQPLRARACVACGQALPTPALLRLGRRWVSLQANAVLPASLASPSSGGAWVGASGQASGGASGTAAQSTPPPWASLAVVQAHPHRAQVLGLRNTGNYTWQVHLPDASGLTVAPGATVQIVPGMQVNFGAVQGQVVVGDPPGVTP